MLQETVFVHFQDQEVGHLCFNTIWAVSSTLSYDIIARGKPGDRGALPRYQHL